MDEPNFKNYSNKLGDHTNVLALLHVQEDDKFM